LNKQNLIVGKGHWELVFIVMLNILNVFV